MIKLMGWILGIILLLYILLCLFFFFFQERFLFFPQKLPLNFRFTYPYDFEECFIEVEEGVKLNGLLFKAKIHANLQVRRTVGVGQKDWCSTSMEMPAL